VNGVEKVKAAFGPLACEEWGMDTKDGLILATIDGTPEEWVTAARRLVRMTRDELVDAWSRFCLATDPTKGPCSYDMSNIPVAFAMFLQDEAWGE